MATIDWRSDEALPQQVRHTLARLCDALRKELGDRLLAFVLFGAVAKGDEFHARTTSVDTLLVLSDTSVAVLESIAPAMTRAQIDLRVTAMIVTPQDLKSSADVFPSKFIDMQENNRVLHGTDPLRDIEILQDHLRLRCEQELKNLLLRLRMRILRTSSSPRRLLETLGEMGSRFVDLLRNLIRLREGQAPTMRAEVVRSVASLNVDKRLLEELLAINRGRYAPPPSEAKALADGLLQAVAHAAQLADTHEASS